MELIDAIKAGNKAPTDAAQLAARDRAASALGPAIGHWQTAAATVESKVCK